MTRGEHLAHSISFALSKVRKIVRGLWLGLTEKERWDVARKTVEHLKEHGDRWKLNEELESPVVEAHATPSSFTEAHDQKKWLMAKPNLEMGLPRRAPLHRRRIARITFRQPAFD
jgi:hypothetical protein